MFIVSVQSSYNEIIYINMVYFSYVKRPKMTINNSIDLQTHLFFFCWC